MSDAAGQQHATAENYPFGPATALSLHQRYGQLRDLPGLAWVQTPWGEPAWLATRWPDVRQVLKDPRFSRALAAGNDDVARARPTTDDKRMLISTDEPDHTRLRGLVSKAFNTRRVESLRSRVQQVVEDLLDRMCVAGSSGDLAASFAWPLPMIVICEMLGVPDDDRDEFRTWTEQTLALGAGTDRSSAAAASAAARAQLNDYLAGQIRQRRDQPTEDLLSALVAARDDTGGDRLSEEEMIRLGVTLLISGHETTANQLGNFLVVLLGDDRAGWRQLVDDPTLVPSAVEELLRYVPLAAVADFARVAREDVLVGGQLVRRGEAVLVQMHAANRDPAVFADPEGVDLCREHNPHMAFGHGIHHCLGAPLARMELQIALTTLIERMPALTLAVPEQDVAWRKDRLVRGVVELPVTW